MFASSIYLSFCACKRGSLRIFSFTSTGRAILGLRNTNEITTENTVITSNFLSAIQHLF